MTTRATFSVVDYCVFGGMLAASLLIGVYHAFRGRRQQTNEEVLLGGRQMSTLPVAVSVTASYISAILILGTTAEVYTNGAEIWMMALGPVLGAPMAAILLVPIMYRCGVTSVFEYIEARFDSALLRGLCVIVYLVRTQCYMAIALYAPSLALSSTSSLSLETSILATAVVGTLYTTFGGLKAVVWADVLQAVIMAAGMVAVVAQGASGVGGFSEMFTISAERGRLDVFDFNLDPWQRYNFWNIVFGMTISALATMGTDQAAVQRFLSLPSLKAAQWACILNIFCFILFISLACLCGLAIFATYADCDPVKMGLMDRADQLVPYFVLDQMSYLTGLPGLFVACVLSGALSTITSGLNAMAAITWADFLSKFGVFQKMSERGQSWVSRFLSFLYGCTAVAMSFVVSSLGGVLQAAISITGALSGPVFGVFVLGIFLPFTNSKGATIGLVVSTAFSLWVTIGSMLSEHAEPTLPTSIGDCGTNLTSLVENPTVAPLTETSPEERSFVEHYVYSLSYQLFTISGCLVCVIVGSFVSFLTGLNEQGVKPSLVNPLAFKLYKRFTCPGRLPASDKQYEADNPAFSMPTYKHTSGE